jgi:DNA-binding response OmpR family regulator
MRSQSPHELKNQKEVGMSRKVLIVDDDQKTRLLLKAYLEKNQYEVSLAHDGESFLTEFSRCPDEWALVILDVMLPDTDGFALCKAVRSRANVPIIMLTASSDETDRIVGLELGADDYIAKPYSPRELLARIKAIHRRAGMSFSPAPRYYRFAGFTLDSVERKVLDAAGEPVNLTGLDFVLLKYFVEHPGEVLDRNVLCEETRGRDMTPLDRSLDVQISRLRLRLNDDAKQPWLIKTVRGAGYVFSVEVEAAHA